MSFFSISDEVTGEGMAARDDVAVLLVSGEIDHAATPHLRSCILAEIEAGRRQLVLDLSAVTFIDSTAIGLLVSAVARLRAAGDGSLAVVCAPDNERVMRIFDIAGVASVVALYGSRGEAVSALAAVCPVEAFGSHERVQADAGLESLDRPIARSAPRVAARAAARLAAAFDDQARNGARASSASRVDRLV
jgi:anti-sigma B factor antagonist